MESLFDRSMVFPAWARHPVFWCLVAGLVGALDYLSGPFVMFPVLFILPILGATIACEPRWGYWMAVLLPGWRFVYATFFWIVPWGGFESLVNAVIYGSVFLMVVAMVDFILRQAREIRTLQEFLPMCSYCRQIRDEKGKWSPLEQFLLAHTETKVSHGICPDCREKHFSEFSPKPEG